MNRHEAASLKGRKLQQDVFAVKRKPTFNTDGIRWTRCYSKTRMGGVKRQTGSHVFKMADGLSPP